MYEWPANTPWGYFVCMVKNLRTGVIESWTPEDMEPNFRYFTRVLGWKPGKDFRFEGGSEDAAACWAALCAA